MSTFDLTFLEQYYIEKKDHVDIFKDRIFIEDDIIAPYQYHFKHSKFTPEQLLWFEVLKVACIDYITLFPTRQEHWLKFRRVKRWFFNDETDEVGSFKYICHQTGVNPEMILKALLRYSINGKLDKINPNKYRFDA